LVIAGNTLFGTANAGGSGSGTVFSIQTNGTDFATVHSFAGSDGSGVDGGVLLSGSTLYGTTTGGGSSSDGTVFSVQTNGTDFATLYNFTGQPDGANPEDVLMLSGNTLFGTANSGGSDSYGTIFQVNTDGTDFTNLYNFIGGSDGAYPEAGLILLGNTLYGTAELGGNSGDGTVFSLALAQAVSETTVTSSSPSSLYGQSGVTFTATVTGSRGTPTGSVQFYTNSQPFGSAVTLSAGSASSAALPTTLAPGNYIVTAVYSGDVIYTTSSGTLSGGQTVALHSTITSISVSGTTLTITATGGVPNGSYTLLQSSNVALPLADWTPVMTGTFDNSGNLNLSAIIVNPANAHEFYILSQ
jgi:uncharacterized repeat protein (TIGR03803 family)